MLEEYEIDVKMTLIWLTVFAAVAVGLNSFYSVEEGEESDLRVVVSDDSPVSGQNIEIKVFQGDVEVEASVLRVNEELFRDTTGVNFTVPYNRNLEITAENEGLEVLRTIQVKEETDGNSGGDENSEGSEGSSESESSNSSDSGSEDGNDTGGENNNQKTDDSDSDESDQDITEQDETAFQLNIDNPEDQASFEGVETVNLGFELSETANYFIRVNGERVAQGSGSGLIEEQIQVDSGSHTWFIRAVHDQEVFDSEIREFTVTEPASITIDDNSTQVIDGYILELGFELENAEAYRVLVDDQNVEEGPTGFSEFVSHKFDSSGAKQVAVQALRQGNIEAEVSREFESTGFPEAQVNWLSPESFDTSTPETEFEVISPVDYNLVYTINEGGDTTEYSYWENNDVSSSTERHSYRPEPLPWGAHSYRIEVNDEHRTRIGLLEGTFETTEERPLVHVNSLGYAFNSDESIHLGSMDLKAYEAIDYFVYLNGTEIVTGRITGTDVQLNEDLGDLTSGEYYEATVNFNSTETSKTRQENFSFEAQ